MGLIEQALKHYKGKRIAVVCALKEEDYLQELSGTLVDGDGDCLVIEEGEGLAPLLVNIAYIAWIGEELAEDEEEEED